MGQIRPGIPQNGPIQARDPPKAKMSQIRLKITKVSEIFIFQSEFVMTVLHFCLYTQVKT